MADCHTRWDGVWVDDEIGRDAFDRERHVLHTIQHTACTLLTVSRGELVADLRRFDSAHFHFDEFVALVAHRHHHLVDYTGFRGSQECASVLLCVLLCCQRCSQLVFVLRKC